MGTRNEKEIKVHLGGVSKLATVIDDVIIPSEMVNDYMPWAPVITALQRVMGDRMLITSVIKSFNGDPRTGTSHPNGWAIDVTFPDRVVPKQNPHFENDIYLMTYLAGKLSGPIMIALESDHAHIEITNIMPGVYRYPTSRPAYYSNDRIISPRLIQDEQLWKVTPSSITLVTDQSKLLTQRNLTLKPLSRSELNSAIAKVSIK